MADLENTNQVPLIDLASQKVPVPDVGRTLNMPLNQALSLAGTKYTIPVPADHALLGAKRLLVQHTEQGRNLDGTPRPNSPEQYVLDVQLPNGSAVHFNGRDVTRFVSSDFAGLQAQLDQHIQQLWNIKNPSHDYTVQAAQAPNGALGFRITDNTGIPLQITDKTITFPKGSTFNARPKTLGEPTNELEDYADTLAKGLKEGSVQITPNGVTITGGSVQIADVTGRINIQATAEEVERTKAAIAAGRDNSIANGKFTRADGTVVSFPADKVNVRLVDEKGTPLYGRSVDGKGGEQYWEADATTPSVLKRAEKPTASLSHSSASKYAASEASTEGLGELPKQALPAKSTPAHLLAKGTALS